MHATLIPAYYLNSVAETRPSALAHPLRALAERLCAPLLAAGGVVSALSPEAQARLQSEAKRLAAVFQRSSSMWRGATATYPCVAINCEDSICPASESASPPCTTFASPGLTEHGSGALFRAEAALDGPAILDAVELAPASLSPPRKA